MTKTHFVYLLTALLLTAGLLVPADRAAAEELKPFFFVSLSGYDAVVSDLDYVGKLGNNPNLSAAVETLLKAMTQDKGLAGLDKTRPWGLVVLPDADNPANNVRVFGFLPVTDLAALLEALQGLGVDAEDGPDGSKQLIGENLPPSTFVKQIGAWAFLTNNADNFKSAPADPVALLGGVEKKYDVALGLVVKNVPEPMKDVFLGQLDMMSQIMAMQQQEMGASAAQMTQMIEQVKRYTNEVDTILLGLVINDASGKTYLDVEMTAKPDTDTAAEMAEMKQAPSDFTGFYVPEATITVHGVRKLSPATIAQTVSSVNAMHQQFLQSLEGQGLEPEQLDKAKQLIGELVGVVTKTVEAGRMDLGAAAWLNFDTATLIAGGTIAEPKKLDKTLRDLVATVTEETPELKDSFKLDAQMLGDVAIHVLSMPAASVDDGGPLAELVGENLEVIVGIGPNNAYLATGRDAMDKLKAAIKASKAAASTEVLPTRASVAVTPLVAFIGKLAPDDESRQQISGMAGVLRMAGDQNHVLVTVEPIPNGMRERVEIEEGLLKTLGVMSQMLSGTLVPAE